MYQLKNGVFPTMITPYNKDGSVDYGAVRGIVDWYRVQGVQGIFSVCQSSEMFYLTLDERVKIAKTVVETAGDDMQVIASGHVAYSVAEEQRELKAMADTGVKAVVMVSNRLSAADMDDDALIAHGEKVISAVPGISLGMYECPYPYKRLLTDKVVKWISDNSQFAFIKDTCCNADMIRDRITMLNAAGGRVRLYNANTDTLLQSLRDGAAGFSGVMANFHADLYVWLCTHWQDEPEKAEKLQSLLSVLSLYEGLNYPVNAKYHMNLMNVPMEMISRVPSAQALSAQHKRFVDRMLYIEEMARDVCGISTK